MSKVEDGPSAVLFGRTFTFDEFVPLYGRTFAAGLAAAWERANQLQRPKPTIKRLAAVKRLFVWLAAQDALGDSGVAGEVYREFRDNGVLGVPKLDWCDAVDAFCERLRNPACTDVIDSPNMLTRRNIVQYLSAGLRQIADTGFLPHVGPLKGCGYGQLSGGNIPALFELSKGKKTRTAFPQPLPNKDIAALAELSRVRLAALRSCAVRRLLQEYQIFRRGQELMQRPDLPSPDEFENALATKVTKNLFSVLPDDPDGMLGGLLRFVSFRRQNRLFVRREHYPIQVLVSHLGGAELLVRQLEGTIDALVAAYAIVLIDTGFDIGTCDDLPANPFIGEVRSGHQRIATISAIKIRSGGKVVEAVLLDGEFDLQVKVPGQELGSVTAIRMWQEMSAPLRARASDPKTADKLWLIAGGSLNQGQPRLCYATAFKMAWNRFLKEIQGDEQIGGLPIQRRMIRPTVLQLRAAANQFEYTAPQAMANHSRSGMTMRYLGATWFKAELARRIREFQDLYEAAAASGIKDAAGWLDIPAAELDRRQAKAVDTGLGFVCLEPRKGIQLGTTKGEPCTRLDACATCPLRRFVPTSESLVALVVFNSALREQSSAFQAGNPERWATTWLPHLALTEGIIAALENGPHRPKLGRAREEARHRLATGEVAMPRLW